MPVPQNVAEALEKLQADFDSLLLAEEDAAEKKNLLALSKEASTLADLSVVNASTEVLQSRESFVALVLDQYKVS